MIEYIDENIWYKKRRKRKKSVKRLFRFIIVFVILLGLFFYYKGVVSTHIINICGDFAYAESTKAVNNAVLSSLETNVKYEDLMDVQKNSDGEIIYMSANTYKINLINKEITTQTQKKLENALKNGVAIPFLAFSGINIISGYGANVYYKAVTVAGVTCDFISDFQSVGINSTLHSLYLDVKSEVFVKMPLVSQIKTCSTKVLVSEAVLVGKVPEIYLNGKLFA